MTNNRLPDIAKKSERLLIDIEIVVRGFSRYHKYTIGSEIRNQAMTVLRLCHRAWRDRVRQAHFVQELIFSIDDLKLSLQLASQLRAFKSFPQFESIIRQADEVGRSAGGWKRQINLNSQNHAGNNQHERVQILSGRSANASSRG